MQAREAGDRPVVLVHSSDIHIDDAIVPGRYHGLDGLRYVLGAADTLGADLVLLAGDTFDHGRVDKAIAQRAADLLAATRIPVVMLPGNHDIATPDGIFHRSGILDVPHVSVIGHTHPERFVLEHLDLEIMGQPHRSYYDMAPLPDPTNRQARWQVILAHGHYVPPEDWDSETHRSWRFSAADVAATKADYIALGHWDRHEAIGDGSVAAYYSGAPDLVQTVNVVRLCPANGVSVERHPLGMPFPRRW